ncbi:MAG: cytochrome c3 family protein [Dehalococcoidales bacterium]|nr:cytochrome c3 family protein [Dehalococcoidales bacterium]
MVNKVKRTFLWLIALMFLGSGLAYAANEYNNSAHGDTSYGVDRTSTSQYTEGNCAHCHEQHASIDGGTPADPLPKTGQAAGPDSYLLFNANHTSQTANFCFDCHRGAVASGSYQTGDLFNRSYSYRAGDYSDDSLDDILEAFSSTSAHNLGNIVTAITDQWGYTANSNPCAACHNPHVVQGDPANLPNSPKTISTTRGWPMTRPSEHGSLVADDIFWGDGSGEKMSDYVGALTYKAPYRYGTDENTDPLEYEPDGSTTATGTNLTDYVSFCLDCHSSSLTSATLGTTKVINWDTSLHGKIDSGYATDAADRLPPYNVTANYVLSCTDCHEPHGSPNFKYLLRKEVNGATSAVTENTWAAWVTFCCKCHVQDHTKSSGICTNCHNHGERF